MVQCPHPHPHPHPNTQPSKPKPLKPKLYKISNYYHTRTKRWSGIIRKNYFNASPQHPPPHPSPPPHPKTKHSHAVSVSKHLTAETKTQHSHHVVTHIISLVFCHHFAQKTYAQCAAGHLKTQDQNQAQPTLLFPRTRSRLSAMNFTGFLRVHIY